MRYSVHPFNVRLFHSHPSTVYRAQRLLDHSAVGSGPSLGLGVAEVAEHSGSEDDDLSTPRDRLITSVELIRRPAEFRRAELRRRHYPYAHSDCMVGRDRGIGPMRVKDFEIAVGEAETPEAIWAVFSEYFRDTDVQRLVYLHLPPLGAADSRNVRLRAEGFPEELVGRYIGERLYRDNPMLRHAHQDVEPIYWDEILDQGTGQRARAGFPGGVQPGQHRRRRRHPCLRAEWSLRAVRAGVSPRRAAA